MSPRSSSSLPLRGVCRFIGLVLLFVVLHCAIPSRANAASGDGEVVVIQRTGAKSYDAAELYESPRLAEVALGKDPFYGSVSRTYLAVPMATLLDASLATQRKSIEFRSTDGFVATIPASALLNADPLKPTAWLAVEPPNAPWPRLPGGARGTAGPFALIWSGLGGDKVWSERWPYQVAEIRVVPAPEERWPSLGLDADASAEVQRGRDVFIAQCFVCHQFGGAGTARIGPDLNWPMSPTQYFLPGALEKYIRNPASVRDWPERRMEAFPVDRLADEDLKALISFLGAKAR